MGCGVSSDYDDINRISTPSPSSQRLIVPPCESTFGDSSSRQAFEEVTGYSYFDSILIYFDSIYESPERKKQFYSILGNKMGQLYTSTLSKIEDKLIKKQIGTDDLKVTFSKTIILQILNMINKLQQRPNWKSQRVEIFKKIANCQKKIIQFLWYKYPRNKKDFIPTELEQVFYSVDDSEHTDYDLLINSGIEFDYQKIQSYERKQVIRQLKRLINAIILQTNRFFETFRETMQKIFANLQGTFKIGRKISQNVNIYKDLDTDNMEIHSPQIFRVIIKFIKYTDQVFINSLEVLKKKKYFKILQKNDDQFQYFPLYTGKNPLISMLISSLQPSSKQYMKQQEEQQVYLANFNDNLAKILTKKTHIPEINQNQIKTIKYAKNITKFVEFLAIEKLIYLITELVHLREKMDKKNRKAIDLITCNINDLLRCQFMGSKKAVLEVFSQLKKLQQAGRIKIIRVKNRFATPLNDVLVNFKFVGDNDSFLICQIQLILKKTGFQGNAKFQAHAKVNHVLYELERSIFGPLAQMSLLLTHNDTRMGYEKKIKLQRTYLHSMRCPQKQILTCQYDLSIPYVCSLCTEFYHINQNSFPIHRCQNCNFYVCPKCLFEFDPELSEQCYMKQIFNILKQKFMPDLDENQEYGSFFFSKKYLKVSQIKKQQKNFFDCLQEKMIELQEDFAFVIRFFEGNKYFNVYHLHPNGQLLPTFYDFLPRFQRKDFKNHQFTPYDIVLFLQPNCSVQLKNSKELSLVTIPLTDVDVNMKLCPQIYFFKAMNNFWMIDIGDQQKDNQSNSIPTSNPDRTQQIQKIIEGYRPRDGQLLLDYLDIIEINFGGFQFDNLRFAKLKSNRIRDLTPILKYQTLQQIDASRNEVTEVKLVKTYKKLRILDFSQNFIENIAGISNQTVPDLKQLNLSNNNLSYFPKLDLNKLLWLNLNENRIQDLQNLKQSSIPKLRKLSITKNGIKQIPMNSQMKQLLDIEAQNNQITNIQFLFCCPKIQQVYLQKNHINQYPQNLHLFYLEKLDLCHNQLTDITNIESSQFPIISHIDFSHNQIKNLPIINFQSLETLSLHNNQLQNIGNLYKSQNLEQLIKLDLSDNKISQFCILVLECLQELDVSHNNITDMTTLVHSKIPALKKLNLSHNQIKNITSFDQPQLIKLQLQNNNLTTMQFFNTSNIPKLQYLNLNQNKIKKFISAEFPSLQELYIKRNQLVDLTQIKQQHLEVLKILDLSQNKILQLPSMYLQSVSKLIVQRNDIIKLDLFKTSQLPCLTTLDLRFNKLKNFPTMKLQNLLVLELDSNQINDMHELSLCQFPLLQQLKLSNNKLVKIDALKMPKLSILNLQRNKIENIDILADFVTPQIMQIKLMRNQIKKLCRFQSNSLNLVDFSHNKISQGIQQFFTSNFPKLLTIKLSSNAIEGSLPKMPNFVSLKLLQIAKNSITDLEEFLLHSNLPKLDSLKLNNNKVIALTQSKLPRLKQLDVSNNKICNVEDFCYSQLPKLQKLFLNNNQIEHLPRLQFNTLTLINLQNNKIQLLHQFSKSDLPSLQKLFLNRNKIKQWPKQFYLQKLLKLHLLENKLSSFTGLNSDTTPQLKELILKKNNIQQIKEIDLPNLIVLNLDGNPIVTSEHKLREALQINSKHGKMNKKLKLVMNKKASQRDNQQDIKQITKLRERTSAQ